MSVWVPDPAGTAAGGAVMTFMMGIMWVMVVWALASGNSGYAIAAGLFAIAAQMGACT